MLLRRSYRIITCITVLLLMPVTAGAADINWATESYRAAAGASVDGSLGYTGNSDENFGPPLPVSASARAVVPGGVSCAHGTSDITFSTIHVYSKACVNHEGVYSK